MRYRRGVNPYPPLFAWRLTRVPAPACGSDYESLHETPLIANTIARMKLYEMNRVISDTAEYGCYLYDQACQPLLTDFMATVDIDVIGTKYNQSGSNQWYARRRDDERRNPPSCVHARSVALLCETALLRGSAFGSRRGSDNRQLNAVNEEIRSHAVEVVGKELRGYMTDMEKISTAEGVGVGEVKFATTV